MPFVATSTDTAEFADHHSGYRSDLVLRSAARQRAGRHAFILPLCRLYPPLLCPSDVSFLLLIVLAV